MSNLSQSEIQPLRAALDRFSIPTPKALQAVDAVATLATATRHAVLSETAPNVDGLTVKNLVRRIDELASWEAMSSHRRNAATAVLSQAEKAQREAWNDAVPELHALFAPKFAEAASRLAAALENLNDETSMEANVARGRGEIHREAAEAAADLTTLMTVRRILHGRLEAVDSPFWRWTQILEIDDFALAAQLDSAVRRGPNGLKDAVEGGLTWWANLAKRDDVALKWNTPTEQSDLLDRLQVPARRAG